MTPQQLREQTIRLAMAPVEEQRRILGAMTWQDVLHTDAEYERWTHNAQLEPSQEGWRTWLMMAGRGFGKTRAGAEWIEKLARSRPEVRIALVGASIEEARKIMVEGVSGLLSVAERNRSRVKWEPSIGRLTWSNGSQAQLFSGDSPDGMRGPEHDFAWCDELAKWRHREAAWDNLAMGLRRGARARALITTTPRPLPLLTRIKGQPTTVTTTGRTDENINLDQQFVDVMLATYGGTRIGRQELDGELIEDVEGALFPRELIEKCRAGLEFDWPPFDRIVVGVDPPAGEGGHCDACGIIVAGKRGGELFVIADESV